MNQNIRMGFGYDVHRFAGDGPLIIGGVSIPHHRGLLGYSDADVLLHALCDALLGSLALGDIGSHFPDTDPTYRDIDSRKLLRQVATTVEEKGYVIENVDATVVAQQPRMASHIDEMRTLIAKDLELEKDQVSVKATTTEKLGFEGREEGISAYAVALIKENHDD